MIRALDRFYRKHPNMAFAAMLVICAVVLYIEHGLASDDTAAPHLQMMPVTSRTAT